MVYRSGILLASVVVLTACSMTGGNNKTTSYELSEDYANSIVRYTVQRGDRLSDIALEFTGEQSKWQAIAEHNGITNPRRLQQGAVLLIPTELIPGYSSSKTGKSSAKPSSDIALQLPKKSAPGNEVVSNSLAVKRASDIDSQNTSVGEVVVSPVETNRDFNLNPIAGISDSGSENSEKEQRLVKVVGTYYPKGVYSQPAVYSDLLMRVAPGTTFRLDRRIDDWYRIVTGDGTGYIRANDAEVINDSPENSNRG